MYLALQIDKLYSEGVTDAVALTSSGLLYAEDSDTKLIRLRVSDDLKLGSKVIVGVPYEFSITLSTLYLKQLNSGGGTTTVPSYRLVIKNILLDYASSGYMKVSVNDKYNYIMTNKKMGNYILGETSLLTGTFRVPIRKRNTEATIKILNDSPLPLSIIGGGYEADYTTRYRVY